MEQKYFKVFSNRDYAHSNELTIKTAFLTLLFNDTLYIMESEAEIERGHADLTLIVRPDRRQYRILDILIEFKFVSLKEAGLDGKTLEAMDRAALKALPAVQSKQGEAEVGLARYREKLHNKFGDLPRLHSFCVVAVGFERLVFSPSEWRQGNRTDDGFYAPIDGKVFEPFIHHEFEYPFAS
ncbi:MAG: PD-(D/E)XK nuclease domain-containing protein [Candidatus Thiosymbion ectosymbiont of Robbea hypermnestra]|nr:PD-(D/E)XK nuclease domain-containing protein [Candidatus Thiosymbion ectosymbiont of Robbea hypermnestra]